MHTLATRIPALVFTFSLLGLVAAGLPAQDLASQPPSEPASPPQVQVCFVLDTTGSMGGLIEGAKAKIWSIANQMIAAQPRPVLQIALVAFRDRGDQYVTKQFDLTDDLDAVYANLQTFAADGGGDEPESVNQALHEAVTRIAWSPDRSVFKVIFLVGDSPPHMDYGDDVKYPDICQLAIKNDLIINSVRCGDNPRTTPIWQEIARRSEAHLVAIGQSGDMQVVSTPVDEELARINVAIGTTLVPYGRAEQRDLVVAKQAASEVAAAPAAADRLAYNVAMCRSVQGAGDLVDDTKNGTAKLASLKQEKLPGDMRGMTPEQQRGYLAQKADQRRESQAQAGELLKRRQAFIDAELQKLLDADKGNAFDQQVAEIIREQGRRKGIQYGNKHAATPTSPQPKDTGGEGQP